MNIFWFRRDLRLNDNVGLFHALESGEPILPIFIFDKNILSELPNDDSRVAFISDLLTDINDKLKKHHKSLAIFYDEPEKVFAQLIKENSIKNVYANHDYEPYAQKRDGAIDELLKKNSIGFNTFKDQVIFEKSEVVKSDGTPYVVYTPYSNKWMEHFNASSETSYKSENLLKNIAKHSYPFLELKDIDFMPPNDKVANDDTSVNLIAHYFDTRNFPSLKTSRVGPHLRFGSISVRQLVSKASKSSNKTYLKELIWREFFMQILWHFPYSATKSFRPKYDHIKWRNNEHEFNLWCEGKTGYPMVDAGMRELNATGFMHNRVRMVTASFLCKHLLIDWRWGEAYFALKLHDYEQSSNVGNWQWAAGSGVDAAPYFRIFNPTEQAKKFDKSGIYIKKWVPELETFDYPSPIVDHKMARERCLTVYKEALDS